MVVYREMRESISEIERAKNRALRNNFYSAGTAVSTAIGTFFIPGDWKTLGYTLTAAALISTAYNLGNFLGIKRGNEITSDKYGSLVDRLERDLKSVSTDIPRPKAKSS